jgi:hypothetical protein
MVSTPKCCLQCPASPKLGILRFFADLSGYDRALLLEFPNGQVECGQFDGFYPEMEVLGPKKHVCPIPGRIATQNQGTAGLPIWTGAAKLSKFTGIGAEFLNFQAAGDAGRGR